MRKDEYVYVYLDPRKPGHYSYGKYDFNFEPFYVGIGSGHRMFDHLYPSRYNNSKSYKSKKIKKIIKLGFKLEEGFIIKIKDNLSLEVAKKFEIYLIKIIGRYDLGKGPLTNNTDGGDGERKRSNRPRPPQSLETRKKRSISMMGNKNGRGGKGVHKNIESIKKRILSTLFISPFNYHKIIKAYDEDGLSFKEIAEEYGVCRKTIENIYHNKNKYFEYFENKNA